MSLKWKSLVPAGLAVSFGLLLFSLPVFGQTTIIEGIVKDPDGKPLQGAVVQIDRTDIKGTYPVKTDKKGHYGHYGLPMGTFDVSVLVDGQVKDLMKGVHPTPGMPATINFELKNAQQLAASGGLTATQEKSMTKEQKEAIEKANKAREEQLAQRKELNDSYSAGKEALDAKMFDAFRKAIALKPDDPAYYNNFALALAKDKKIDEAKTNLDKAIQLDPPGAGKYYYNMGALLVNGSQSEAAGEEFKKAIDADATYADAHYQYGLYLTSKATTDKDGKIIPAPGTIDELQKYLQLKPDGPFAASAKELIAGLGGTVSTTFQNPNAPPAGKKKK